MVNITALGARERLRAISIAVGIYVALVLGTLVALGILSATAPHLATQDAWVHAVIVGVFAVVLPLRLRAAARSGGPGALRPVGIIAAVLFLVNVVEVLIPGLFPMWMRVEMIGIAVVTLAVILLVFGERAGAREGRGTT
jgi:hypothetical protein